ncbi:Na/Pi cotransporter family protein [Carnobacteriaceae bacterium zg-ZUI252]|nr:Na/Pi cotransporter family protein [Carnobacteriaceae bacterium zg-ZUI252]QTU83603.1 Na/Pi cotransporter family protein [Carnobacteriaceae bacterium zg-C25]
MMLNIVLGAIGGLGLFLYGMNLMADSLQKVAGNRLKEIIRSLTRNRFMSVLVGMFVTMIIQSSSATSVMVVSFVNAELMNLSQAVGIIFGANIGTTITGQLVSFNLSQFAPLALGLGLAFKMFTKKPAQKEIADIFVGFGILFIGMSFLTEALSPLKESSAFIDWIQQYGTNPLTGVMIGFVMTLILQSSSATIGVLIALAANGILPFSTALFIIFGDNIGTCTTALLSSLGASRRGKRVALIHLSFNIIGTIYFILFLTGILTQVVTSMDPGDVSRQIANAHSLFNIINVIVLFPFANLLVKLAYWLLPETPDEVESQTKPSSYLDTLLLATPTMAFNNAMYEIVSMASQAEKTLNYAIEGVQSHDTHIIDKALRSEKKVNAYEKNIIAYLIQLSNQENISATDLTKIDLAIGAVHDIERISDHAENIAEFAQVVSENKTLLTDDIISELNYVYDLTKKSFFYAIDAFSSGNAKDIEQVKQLEREIDTLKAQVRDGHIKRMNKGLATPESGVFVMDLLSNLERISDHARNISEVAEKTGALVAF